MPHQLVRAPRRPFFFLAAPTAHIYTLSLHDALPICPASSATTSSCGAATCSASPPGTATKRPGTRTATTGRSGRSPTARRSEEHTSELQSQFHLVCRLLLDKKNQTNIKNSTPPIKLK